MCFARCFFVSIIRTFCPRLFCRFRRRSVSRSSTTAALAVRTCGGQGVLKGLPLERLYRDARCGSAMLPWSAELCLDRLGRESLYDAGEGDEFID